MDTISFQLGVAAALLLGAVSLAIATAALRAKVKKEQRQNLCSKMDDMN